MRPFQLQKFHPITREHVRSLVEAHGSASVAETMVEAMRLPKDHAEHLDYRRFTSIRAIAEGISSRILPSWEGGRDLGFIRMGLTEDAIDSTMFVNISGQIVFSRLMEGFEEADGGDFDQICETIPTKFNGEKIPGISPPVDEGFTVAEGAEYDQGTMNEDYIETPATTKRGQIVYLTKEAVFFDRTGMLLQQAAKVGERLATLRLKNMLRVVCGITNTFKWRGTSYNTYQTSTPWINQKSSNALSDWKNVEAAWIVGQNNLDPNTGEPILFRPTALLVTPANAMTAKFINNATEVRKGDGASATQQTVGSNPIAGMIPNIIVSAQMRQLVDLEGGLTQAQADATWFLGDFRKAFKYMQNWPLTPATLLAGSDMEFTRDVVAGYKASERGTPAVFEPRLSVYNPGA